MKNSYHKALFSLLLILVMNLSYSAEVDLPFAYGEGLGQENRRIVFRAIDIFINACRPLIQDHYADIEQITAIDGAFKSEDYGCLDYRCDEYGWEKELRFIIKIKDNATTFSGDLRYIAGHTLHFWLGGPTNPGITTTKFPQVCGYNKPLNGEDIYIPVPEIGHLWD